MGADITIRVTRETWQDLHDLKGPGDSFDDILRKLLDDAHGGSEEAVAES